MKISHIIWDWNGTLFDDAPACVKTLNKILERRGLTQIDLEQYREIFRFPVKDYYEILGFDFSVEDWDAMAKEFHVVYFDVVRKMKLRNGIIDVLRSLRERNIPMSVLSAAETSILERFLKEYGTREFFDNVSGLTDIYASSKLEVGRNHVQNLTVPAGEILFIGDTVHDFEVATALKCHCVLITNGHQAEQRLRECGCPVFASTEELADYLGKIENSNR